LRLLGQFRQARRGLVDRAGRSQGVERILEPAGVDRRTSGADVSRELTLTIEAFLFDSTAFFDVVESGAQFLDRFLDVRIRGGIE